MELSAFRTRMHTASSDENCLMLFGDDKLFACLVQLDFALHGKHGGCWFVEHVFGGNDAIGERLFVDVEDAIECAAEAAFGKEAHIERPMVNLHLPIQRSLTGIHLQDIILHN